MRSIRGCGSIGASPAGTRDRAVATSVRKDGAEKRRSVLARAFDSDVFYSFRRSPVAVAAAVVTLASFVGAIFAPWIAPHNPFDLRTLNLMEASTPPVWIDGGTWKFILGADDQGRDVLSAILYGARISLFVGFCSVLFAMVLGVGLGLISGYVGGVVDAAIMRVADVQLSFPAILIALLVDGVARVALPREIHDDIAIYVLVLAIGVSNWVQYARTVRGSTLVERRKEYVQAAQVIGLHPAAIMARHVLPNVMGPVLVIGTINLAIAIVTEATLSFLGVGVPSTQPSLGTLIRTGNNYLFSGEWWITIFPGAALVIMVLSVNLLGDWLRDALNPKLR
ncbi:MAG: ABC transporter permease [Rhodospirillales bacterium]|nr:ABC transporter permease [Rhodospirillales bacterium]